MINSAKSPTRYRLDTATAPKQRSSQMQNSTNSSKLSSTNKSGSYTSLQASSMRGSTPAAGMTTATFSTNNSLRRVTREPQLTPHGFSDSKVYLASPQANVKQRGFTSAIQTRYHDRLSQSAITGSGQASGATTTTSAAATAAVAATTTTATNGQQATSQGYSNEMLNQQINQIFAKDLSLSMMHSQTTPKNTHLAQFMSVQDVGVERSRRGSLIEMNIKDVFPELQPAPHSRRGTIIGKPTQNSDKKDVGGSVKKSQFSSLGSMTTPYFFPQDQPMEESIPLLNGSGYFDHIVERGSSVDDELHHSQSAVQLTGQLSAGSTAMPATQGQHQMLHRKVTLISQLQKSSSSTPMNANASLGGSAIIGGGVVGFQTSEQILKDFFPNFSTAKQKMSGPIERQQEQQLEQKKRRMEQYDQIFTELKNKRKTFSKFAFKSHEKTDNASIRPVLEDLAEGDTKGSMSVIDLWSDKNINKFLGNCKLIKDKLMINKIASIKKRRGFFLDEKKPYLLSRKDELNLINKVYMSEQSKHFQEKYAKQLQKTIQNSNELNKVSLHQQNLLSKKLSEQKVGSSSSMNDRIAAGAQQSSSSQSTLLSQSQSQPSISGFNPKHRNLIGMTKNGLPSRKHIPEEDDVLSGSDDEDNNPRNIDAFSSPKPTSSYKYTHNSVSPRMTSVNYNKFLKDQNIVKSEPQQRGSYLGKIPAGVMPKSFSSAVKTNNFKNMNTVNLLKANIDMIKDLDYLQEQNDKDYEKLIDTINTLQDRIVMQKIANLDPSIAPEDAAEAED